MSPMAVTWRNAGDGVGAVPIVLFTLTVFTWLNKLNASNITSSRWRPPKRIGRESRRSNDDVPQSSATFEKHENRAELRPTPSGRSFTVVWLFRSPPVTMFNGNGVA